MQNFPNPFLLDQADKRIVDVEFPRDETLISRSVENGESLSVGEFGSSALFAAVGDAATLFSHVPHIVVVRPKKEMIYIHAGGHVAFVADLHSFRRFPVCRNPSRSVRVGNCAAEVDFPVPLGVQESGEKDAAIRSGLASICEPLRKRPVTRRSESGLLSLSHWSAFLRRLVVRAVGALQVPGGPNIIQKSVLL